jgi:DNA-binding NarL/FixJ family response regulator
MIKAGAVGYLVKNCASHELVAAIRAVVGGKTYVSPEIAGDVVQYCLQKHADDADESPFSKLTERERQVLQLLAEGNSVKEIAHDLGLSVNTVHTHRQNLMDKLKLTNTAELVKLAIREGLTSA